MPQGHNLRPLSRGLWGEGRHPQKKNSRPFNSVEQNDHIEMLVVNFLKNDRGRDRGGDYSSNYFCLLKRAVAFSISNRMSPFWIFYDNTFYKNLLCPQRINYNLSPEDFRGDCHSQRRNFRTLKLRSTKWLYQNVDRKCLGKWWV
jgi:hypothetical protein